MNWKKLGKKFIDILHLTASFVTIGIFVISSITSAAGTGFAFFSGFIVSGIRLLILWIAIAVLTIFFIVIISNIRKSLSSSKIRKSHCIADEIRVYSKNITKHLQHAFFEIDRNTKKQFTNQVVNAEDADGVPMCQPSPIQSLDEITYISGP